MEGGAGLLVEKVSRILHTYPVPAICNEHGTEGWIVSRYFGIISRPSSCVSVAEYIRLGILGFAALQTDED